MREDVVHYLNHYCTEDDIVPGVVWVGDASGDNGTDWRVYDPEAVDSFVAERMNAE